MTQRFTKEKVFGDTNEALCCSYIEWKDGSKTCDLKKGVELTPQSYNQTINFSASFKFKSDDATTQKSEFFGLDLEKSTVNSFLTLIGWSDVFQDFVILSALMFVNGAAWTQFISLIMLLTDLFSIYVTSFNAPLGVRSVYVEKIVLSAIHMLDVFYDFGVVTMFIFAGVHFEADHFLIGVYAAALPILAGNFLQLYYTAFDYEKDHSDEYDFDDKNVYV